MKYYVVFLLASLLSISTPGTSTAFDDPSVAIEMTLVDESLAPIPAHLVTARFPQTTEEFARYNFIKHEKNTNASGVARFVDRAILGPSIEANAPGFYKSKRKVALDVTEGGIAGDKWQPYPFVEQLMLKRIVKPVPMFAAAACEILLPQKSGSFAFDLEKRDWVQPQGSGIHADIIFKQEKKEDAVAGSTASLSISFTNFLDGTIPLYELKGSESELNLPRTAPPDGYQREYSLVMSWRDGSVVSQSQFALGHVYKVRAKLDTGGNVQAAWFGKIDGDFKWDPVNFNTAQIVFTYYLNPDGTNNLEFDRTKNLFLNLPSANKVLRP